MGKGKIRLGKNLEEIESAEETSLSLVREKYLFINMFLATVAYCLETIEIKFN